MKKFLDFWKRIEPDKKVWPKMHSVYDGFFTIFFKQNHTTQKGSHIRDGIDLKRTMIHVVIALTLCYIVGAYNVGHQHFLALGYNEGLLDGFHLKLVFGLMQILPIFIVVHVVGLAIEFYFAAQKGHPIEEGFLVTGALIPLIMPPDVPLWMLALAVFFAVVLGKEAFGGTGMNILNVALLARAFIFFAYPTEISGDGPWIATSEASQVLENGEVVKEVAYAWWHVYIFNPLFGALGLSQFETGLQVVDGFSGATPLAVAYKEGWVQINEATGAVTGGILAQYSPTQMFMGGIPGCIGETCKPAIILGGVFLLVTRIASWRIMLSMALGAAITGMLFNAWEAIPFMTIPWYHHFSMGGLLFALVFMATDPVTAASTNTGKWIYGALIGFFGMVIRVMNPAYAEGWMLAILLMNVFSPLIDHYVLEANISKRMKRAQQYAK